MQKARKGDHRLPKITRVSQFSVKVIKKRLKGLCHLTIKYYFCSCFPAMGSYQSGQMGQTVNLLALAFGGSNPSLPTQITTHTKKLMERFITTQKVLFF